MSLLTRAYLNHGRWVIDCPNCRTGWRVKPETPFAIYDARWLVFAKCFCGWMPSEGIQFPNDFDSICEYAATRPRLNQNWTWDETVFDLLIENAAHGVGRPI